MGWVDCPVQPSHARDGWAIDDATPPQTVTTDASSLSRIVVSQLEVVKSLVSVRVHV